MKEISSTTVQAVAVLDVASWILGMRKIFSASSVVGNVKPKSRTVICISLMRKKLRGLISRVGVVVVTVPGV